MITILKNTGKRAFCLLLALAVAVLAPLTPTARAASEDRFVIGLVSESGATINPYHCTQRDLININELIFESVLTLDDNLQPVGELALSWTQSGKTFVFKLRDNVRFHDGSYLSAQDVYASFEYIRALGESSPYYTRCQYISSIEVTDTSTLTVTGKYESYLTLYAMTFPVAQRDSVSWNLPCGTGPYWYMNYDADWLQVDANPVEGCADDRPHLRLPLQRNRRRAEGAERRRNRRARHALPDGGARPPAERPHQRGLYDAHV